LLQNLDKLKKDLNEKSTFMNKMGLLQAGRTSFFADRIAAMIPASIQLKEMNINPLVKNPNDDKDIAFNVNSIVVKGDCKKNTELNEWIKQLKRFDWVNDVTLTNFTQDKEKNMGIFNMELKVK
jgi:Tfp pilus assembly protein PilN